MSQENVEVFGRAIEARQRGKAWAATLDPEFEWDLSVYLVSGAPGRP
jgi:hypothetical protein